MMLKSNQHHTKGSQMRPIIRQHHNARSATLAIFGAFVLMFGLTFVAKSAEGAIVHVNAAYRATTISLYVAPHGEVNPQCPRATTGYDFAILERGKLQHGVAENGGIVFKHVGVVVTARRNISYYSTTKRWTTIKWTCEA
jgi:hypothetical protein